jgi:hypothetical protein
MLDFSHFDIWFFLLYFCRRGGQVSSAFDFDLLSFNSMKAIFDG